MKRFQDYVLLNMIILRKCIHNIFLYIVIVYMILIYNTVKTL